MALFVSSLLHPTEMREQKKTAPHGLLVVVVVVMLPVTGDSRVGAVALEMEWDEMRWEWGYKQQKEGGRVHEACMHTGVNQLP